MAQIFQVMSPQWRRTRDLGISNLSGVKPGNQKKTRRSRKREAEKEPYGEGKGWLTENYDADLWVNGYYELQSQIVFIPMLHPLEKCCFELRIFLLYYCLMSLHIQPTTGVALAVQ